MTAESYSASYSSIAIGPLIGNRHPASGFEDLQPSVSGSKAATQGNPQHTPSPLCAVGKVWGVGGGWQKAPEIPDEADEGAVVEGTH